VLVTGYVFSRGRWCNITVLKVHATSEDSKARIYEELEQVFNHILTYRMNILLGECNEKLGREGVFKPTIGNDSLH
jgi:hypothetical protein